MCIGRVWTKSEIDILEDETRALSKPEEIGRMLGRSKRAVMEKRNCLMLKTLALRRTQYCDFLSNYPGHTADWYAKRMKVSKATVFRYLRLIRRGQEQTPACDEELVS